MMMKEDDQAMGAVKKLRVEELKGGQCSLLSKEVWPCLWQSISTLVV